VGGIPIRVHWSFGLLVLLFVAATAGSGAGAVVGALIWLVLLFGSVVFHELAHSLVARRRGIAVRDIVLLPIGGVSEIPELDRTPADEFAISVAGPASSVVLAVFIGAVAKLGGAAIWPPTLLGHSILADLAWLNLLLAGFNLIPAIPLDGGRVLRSLLSTRRGEPQASELASKIGVYFAIAMVIVGIWIDVWLVLIGIFVFLGARSEGQVAQMKAALGGRHIGDLASSGILVLHGSVTIGELLATYPNGPPASASPVEDETGYVGMAYAPDLLRAPAGARLADVADRHAPLLDPSTPLFPQALSAFNECRRPVLAVGTDGKVTGVVFLGDLQETLRRSAPVGR
jgi:Zn-dependent protease